MNPRKNSKIFFYALDIGSDKMALAGAVYDYSTHTLGPVFVEIQASRGIFKGVVNDLALLSDCVHRLLRKMEERTGVRITQLALSINGNYIQAKESTVVMPLTERGTRTIHKRDAEKLMSQAKVLGLDLEEDLLHDYALGYSIDRHNMILNPLGLQGRRFEMKSLLISAKAIYLENIKSAIERAGCNVTSFVFSGVASSEGILSQDQKEKGVVLIDIGDTLTSVLIFKDALPRYIKILPFGGRNLTDIIASYFKISSESAKNIKESSLELSGDIADTEEIMIKDDLNYRSIKKRQLVEIIMPEIEKFIGLLKNSIEASCLADIPGAEVVVTGGLSLLEGLLERIENAFGMPVRMGVIKGLSDIPVSKVPLCVGAIGLLYLQKNTYQKSSFLFYSKNKNRLFGIIGYLKALYQDYF